jgi:hypothetical protein
MVTYLNWFIDCFRTAVMHLENHLDNLQGLVGRLVPAQRWYEMFKFWK